MLYKSIAIALATMIAMSAVEASAADIKITQAKKKFSTKKVKAAVGDTLVFINEDTYTHNLFAKKGMKFDSGVMKNGDIYKVVVDKPGKISIRCAIHPKMKLRVTAE